MCGLRVMARDLGVCLCLCEGKGVFEKMSGNPLFSL